MEQRRPDWIEITIQTIDEQLNRPVITIEDSLIEAVAAGRMSKEEGQECLQAYLHFLHKED